MRTNIARRWLLPLLIAVLSGAAGCRLSPADGDEVRVEIRGPDHDAPDRFAVIMARTDGTVQTWVCGEELAPDECTADGILLHEGAAPDSLVVKAPGHRTRTLTGSELEPSSGRIVVVLEALPAPEITEDYATGFTTDQDLDALTALAWPADTELGPVYVIKFLIIGIGPDAPGPPTLYLQDTLHHPIHLDFARDVLGLPLTPQSFVEETYVGEDRSMMAGSLLVHPTIHAEAISWGHSLSAPVLVTFFPSDDLSPAQALLAFGIIEEGLGFLPLGGTEHRLAYLPAGSIQEEQLHDHMDAFRRRGAPWIFHREMAAVVDMQFLNPGVAFGTLRLLTPEQLEMEVVSWTDILVLPRLPAVLPVVGGTITEEFQTPLAHVNVAARNRGTPNMALPGASEDPRVEPLLGKLVRLEVDTGDFSLREATLEEAQAFWEENTKAPFIPEYDDEMTGLPGFDDLYFDDWISVGVKAANLAELHRLLPENAPDGFAIPFSHYEAFMTASRANSELCNEARIDCVEEGRAEATCDAAHAICGNIGVAAPDLWAYADALLADPQVQGDSVIREAVLDGLVYVIGHVPVDEDFGAALDARVAEVFGDAKVRLRSSTNAEDLPNFSGAGLYRSVSAWAEGDKKASSRVRKVWASAWSFRAVEERAWWNIDHFAVRMGVAVNQAFVDEAANGVLITRNIADPTVEGMYVNVQQGEISVTNPEDGALPEVFSMIQGPGGVIQVARAAFSSLSPDAPILSKDEITDLFWNAWKVQQHFARLYNQSEAFLAMDLEFKFHGPDRTLSIKQARPYTVAE